MERKSVASHLKALNGKRVIMRTAGMPVIEDIESMRETLLLMLDNSNIPREMLKEDSYRFYIDKGTQFWLKPKISRMAKGKLVVRSKTYIFYPDNNPDSKGMHGSLTHFIIPEDESGVVVKKMISAKSSISFELAE